MIAFETLLIIIEQALLHFPLLLGAYISISLIKTPDLSLESAYVFGALISGTMIPLCTNVQQPVALIILLSVALCAGAFVGALSSTLTRYVNIPHLLSSIITVGIFHGLNQFVAGTYLSLSSHKNFLVYEFITLHPEIPVLTVISIALTCAALLFFRSQLGYSCAVLGYNPHFFSNYGISSSYVFVSGIVIANALAGLSGYLIAQSNGFAEINMGFGKILLCITALILGKLVHNKTLSIIVPTAGIFMYFTVQQLLLKVGFDLRYFTMIQALVILVVLIAHYSTNKSIHSDQLGV